MFFKHAAKINLITYLVISIILSLMVLFLPSGEGVDPMLYVLIVYGFFTLLNGLFLYVSHTYKKDDVSTPKYIKVLIIISMLVNIVALLFNLEGITRYLKENQNQ